MHVTRRCSKNNFHARGEDWVELCFDTVVTTDTEDELATAKTYEIECMNLFGEMHQWLCETYPELRCEIGLTWYGHKWPPTDGTEDVREALTRILAPAVTRADLLDGVWPMCIASLASPRSFSRWSNLPAGVEGVFLSVWDTQPSATDVRSACRPPRRPVDHWCQDLVERLGTLRGLLFCPEEFPEFPRLLVRASEAPTQVQFAGGTSSG